MKTPRIAKTSLKPAKAIQVQKKKVKEWDGDGIEVYYIFFVGNKNKTAPSNKAKTSNHNLVRKFPGVL